MSPGDLRLLVPAVVAWGVVAATLGTAPGLRAVLAACAALVGGRLAVRLLRGPRRPGRHAWHVAGGGAAAVALALVASAIALGAAGLQTWRREAGTTRWLADQGAVVRLRATVASDPRAVAPQPGSRGTAGTVLVQLSLHGVDGRGLRSAVRARVLVFGTPDWRGLHLGEQVEATGRLAPARRGDDVVATVTARGPPQVVGRAPRVDRVAERLRSGLRRACAGLPADARGLLPGLVVGDTSLQPADLGEAMRATGLTHLSAVSGTNTTLVCLVALALGRGAGLGHRARLVVAGLVLVGFVVLARPEPSVLRAAVMGALGLLSFGTARRRAALPVLAATVLALLVADPWLARSFGFALSVLATLGLLLVAQPWTEALSRRLPRPLAAAVAVPLAAQAFCGPVVVLLSGQVSLVSVPANLLAEPCVAPATVLGLAAAVASVTAPGLAALLAHVAGVACSAIALVARAGARVPGGQLGWPGGAGGAVLLAVLTVAAAVGAPHLRRTAQRRPRAAALAVGAVLALVLAARAPVPGTRGWPPPGWVLVVCDVGQGDALVLRTGTGRAVLVDAGPAPDDVDRCLRELDVRTLDLVVLTHFHADHVDGLPGALRGRRVGQLVTTIVDDPAEQARQVRRQAAAAGVPVRTVVDGERVRLGDVSWQVLWPARVVHDGSVPNNASIVLRVDAGGLRLLLLGDVEPAAARQVAARVAALPGGPRVDVLKVAHHGSAQQDPQLLAETAPRLALVSVGADNDYGHPSPALLRLLAGQGATVARTDRQGDLAVVRRAGGPALVVSGPRPHAVGPRR
ncbi:ComEC/Rec2 family competence protein [Angustibacter peucedani]